MMSRWSDQIIAGTEKDIIVAQNSYFTTDGTFRPECLPPPPGDQACNSLGWAFPTMVLEVGYSESIHSLHEWAPFYLSQHTTIMIYLAIKIYPLHAQQPGVRPMVAMLYQRKSQAPNIPTRVISFGNAPLYTAVINFLTNTISVSDANITGIRRHGAPPCNTSNIPTYQLPIPATELFHQTPFIFPSVNFNLDLWQVQRRINYQ